MSTPSAAPSTDLARREARVTCLLADPDVERAATTRRYLESRGLSVIGTPDSAAELIVLAELYGPNAVIVDDGLAPGQGHVLTAVLQARAPRSGIIVATDGGDRDTLIQLLEAGARGVLVRDAPRRDLLRAIEMVCDGRFSISVRLLGLLDEEGMPERIARLDSRERAVLRSVVNGLRGSDLLAGLPGPTDVKRELTAALTKLQQPRITVGRLDVGLPEPAP